jgi:hypothetical protein
MRFKMNKIRYLAQYICVLFIVLLSFCGIDSALAACVGKLPIFGTGDDRRSCAIKAELKKEEKQLEIQEREERIARKKRAINNSGTGAGTGNTNVILGGLRDMTGNKLQEEPMETIVLTQHQARVELMPYVIPGAYQFDAPGMPEKVFFNGAAWEYYVNKNLGFGILWQEWAKRSGRKFDPVMNNHPDASGDYHSTATVFPGGIDRIKYTLYIPYVTVNTQLGSPLWNGVFRCGIGRTQAEIEYNDINYLAYPYATQSEDVTRIDNTAIMFDLAVERWTYGFKLGGALRYVNARYDTMDYHDYISLSSAQFIIYAQFMIRPLGLL